MYLQYFETYLQITSRLYLGFYILVVRGGLSYLQIRSLGLGFGDCIIFKSGLIASLGLVGEKY